MTGHCGTARVLLVAGLLLTACAPAPDRDLTGRQATPDIALPAMNTFATLPARSVTRSNASIASDFMTLA